MATANPKANSNPSLPVSPPSITLIVTLTNQTGDQGHVAAAMALDPLTDVLIIFEDDSELLTVASMVAYFQGVVDLSPPSSPKRKRVYTLQCTNTEILPHEVYNLLMPKMDEESGEKEESRTLDVRILQRAVTNDAVKALLQAQYGIRNGYPLFEVITLNQVTANIAREFAKLKGAKFEEQLDEIKKMREEVKKQQKLTKKGLSKDPATAKAADEEIVRLNGLLKPMIIDQKSAKDHLAAVQEFETRIAERLTDKDPNGHVTALINKYLNERREGYPRLPPKIVSEDTEDAEDAKDANSATKAVVLLWARYSGGNSPNGYNPAGDSSVGGQKQLVDAAKDAFEKNGIPCTIVTVGHDRLVNGRPYFYRVENYNLGEFYNDDNLKTLGRLGQALFFKQLKECYPNALYQIGQKTGAMDIGALMGIPTLYLEKKADSDGARMKIWAENLPYYDYVDLTEDHTYLGKVLTQFNKLPKKAQDAYRMLPEKDNAAPLSFKEKKKQEVAQARKIRMLQTLVWLDTNNKLSQLHGFHEVKGNVGFETLQAQVLAVADPEILTRWENQIYTQQESKEKYSGQDPGRIKNKLGGLIQSYRRDVNAKSKAAALVKRNAGAPPPSNGGKQTILSQKP